MTAEDLKKAPAMKTENCRELSDSQRVARVDQFFRSRSRSSESGQQDDRSLERDRQAVQRVLLATKLRSAKIKNDRNEDLGKLEELLFDSRYRVPFAIKGG
jgi:hypothetical protein